jgi:Queuosine salvage protein
VKNLFEQVRMTCREVAAKATRIHINYDYIPAYAASLPVQMVLSPELDPGCHYLDEEENTVAFLLTLDTINFGSGYFPHLRKRPGMSGYFSIASSLNDMYKSLGGLSAADLDRITVDKCTRIFGQDPANRIIGELMQHFTTALNDLGRYLLDCFDGNFAHLVEAADSSAQRLVRLLKKMPYFNDVEPYDGIEVPFYKRAQIAAADLSIAFKGQSWGNFNDLDQLTIFADNLVPHVLRMDGVLIYEQFLTDRIAAGASILAGSPEEVEIRACAVHAVELVKKELRNTGQAINSSDLDNFLWNRGQHPQYKAVPRHRTRCVFY